DAHQMYELVFDFKVIRTVECAIVTQPPLSIVLFGNGMYVATVVSSVTKQSGLKVPALQFPPLLSNENMESGFFFSTKS
ncbi:MAG: hypothetical protein EZS28_053897, partial [Streblomastix strix]